MLARLDQAANCALETAGPGHLAYIPGSGLYSAALAEFYNRALNRYGGLASVAPALAALEESLIRWMAHDVCGLPKGSGGLLTSGGSMATFSATVAARHDRLGEDLAGGTVYTTAFAHHSVAKAARLAGIRSAHIRTVPHTPDLRMDPGSYLQDMEAAGSVPDSGHLGPELTHEIRGLRAWLPLHLHGVDAFRDALDEKLDLAEHVHEVLSGVAELEVPQRPDLSTVIFRVRPADGGPAAAERADEASRRLLERINGHRRVVLSSTVVGGRYTLRVCVVSHRTHHDRIAEALQIITAEARNIAAA
ncbi:glutamate/tyrosine decarboxylase-like PLP-dependent enzyme [Streptomyces paradoxus]|uniref:Glutamate/tyrosine decarboxylase-like PLP-dependent enzyme n=1 Tax=Streptomyces paradoxus TaxID=66375 RepID=A0A7W9TIY9_9ACTN|nr:glutamate/tyrosine decarboxylase-like PLP-dependent enzyme [Streptomyces paradoxus]